MVDPPDISRPQQALAHDRHQSCKVKNPVNKAHHTLARKVISPIVILIATLCLLAFISTLQTVSATALPPTTSRHDDQHTASNDFYDALPAHLKQFEDGHDGLPSGLFDFNTYSDADQQDAAHLIERLFDMKRRRQTDTTGNVESLRRSSSNASPPPSREMHTYPKRDISEGQRIGYGILVPVLVLLSGIFAGLTLGYMSLDETQLQVLSSTGTEKQKKAAQRIIPIRKDGHLLLTTLLIANMITNETLPVISEPLFPTSVLAVVVPTVLIIIFSELVPQSVCSRYGLEIGAFMAVPTRIVMFGLWPIAWPVSRVLHWTLGPHHGIVYRRAELKELVTMHAASGGRGGDLKGDTVMMVGGALDLQEKVAKDAMTPIDKVFMLPLDAKLDYRTLERVVRSGHSRIPIYQEIEVPVSMKSGTNTPSKRGLPTLFNALTRRGTANNAKQLTGSPAPEADSASDQQAKTTDSLSPPSVDTNGMNSTSSTQMIKRKKIVGTLLVKSCVLLDPEDAVPVTEMTINALPSVPNDEPLLNVLNAFQEGRSHMAIVTALSRSESSIDPSAVKGLSASKTFHGDLSSSQQPRTDGLSDIDEERQLDTAGRVSTYSGSSHSSGNETDHGQNKLRGFWKKHFGHEASLEQSAPSDATLADPAGDHTSVTLNPSARGDILGVITLEDVLEELIGEEIYDEYDPREDGDGAWNNLTPPMSPDGSHLQRNDPLLEKKLGSGSETAFNNLPPPAIADGEKQETASVAQPPKTLLGRLGLSGRKGGSAPPTTAREKGKPASDAVDAPAPSTAAVNHPINEKVPVINSPEAMETTGSAATHADEGPDYLNALAAGTRQEDQSSQEAPQATALPSHLFSGKSSSRPASPGGTLKDKNGPSTADAPPLASPQPSRPVVLRKQRPDGSTQNVIVGEHLLRGRKVAPGTPVIPVPLEGQSGAEGGSRSSTPKPNRFKSTPVSQSSRSDSVPPTRGRSESLEPPRRQNTSNSLKE
ncbi:unnamed protein product [Sympodiomycopsis kandeliae]